jgi:mitochondrial-processing peptidase subunit beta
MHEGAFQSSLGYTILGKTENILTLKREQMLNYRDTFYTAPRMALVGVGEINHNDFVSLAKKYFSGVQSKPKNGYSDKVQEPTYIGAEVRVQEDNIPNLYHAVAFQGPSIHSADMLTINMIQLLIGNWDISMGAGKASSSQFCSLVAHQGLARNVQAFNHAYSDTSLFGIQTVSNGTDENTEDLNSETIYALTKFCYKVRDEDVIRAKNILKIQILSQYEGRLDSVCEEVGKQILFYGRRPSPAEMFSRIDSITKEDVLRVAQKYIYDQDPIVTAIGNTHYILEYQWMRQYTYYWR